MKEIAELHVHSLDGEFYQPTRTYLEQRGCVWSETRGEERELLSVHVAFPKGTKYRDISRLGAQRYSIALPEDSGFIYWYVRGEKNRILVPYFNLLNGGVL